MRVALTGTPGVGKTTLAALAAEAGWQVVALGDWAHEVGAVTGRDEDDDADIIDMEHLIAAFPPRSDAADLLLDGHLAHQLPVDAIWVLRCDPAILEGRLQARGYSEGKIRENLESEAMDLILQEALATGRRVVQRDASQVAPDALWNALSQASTTTKNPDLEPVDWSDWLLASDHGP